MDYGLLKIGYGLVKWIMDPAKTKFEILRTQNFDTGFQYLKFIFGEIPNPFYESVIHFQESVIHFQESVIHFQESVIHFQEFAIYFLIMDYGFLIMDYGFLRVRNPFLRIPNPRLQYEKLPYLRSQNDVDSSSPF